MLQSVLLIQAEPEQHGRVPAEAGRTSPAELPDLAVRPMPDALEGLAKAARSPKRTTRPRERLQRKDLADGLATGIVGPNQTRPGRVDQAVGDPRPARRARPRIGRSAVGPEAGSRGGVAVATGAGIEAGHARRVERRGGGQILRTALTLSLLTGRPFRIVKIRANRDKPGLRPQHLKAVEAAAMLGGAEVVGGSVGSRDLTFRPGPLDPRDLRVDIGTAGATALVLQTLHLPLALRADGAVRLTLTGGTFNESAPSFPFLESTWRAHLAAIGMPVALAMPAAGYYPEGGGPLEAWIEPATPRPLVLEDRGRAGPDPGRWPRRRTCRTGIAGRMADRAVERWPAGDSRPRSRRSAGPGPGQGASITLVAEFADGPARHVRRPGQAGQAGRGRRRRGGRRAARPPRSRPRAPSTSTRPTSSSCPWPSPRAGASTPSPQVTEHLRTNVETIRAFLDRPIRVEESGEGPGGRVVVG